jgi:hypothetical protein
VEWFFYEGAGESGVIGCSTRDLVTDEVGTIAIINNNNGTTGIPAVAVYDNKIYCVHEGAGQSGRLYYFTYDGAVEQWTDDQEIPTPVVAGSDRHDYPSVALAAYQGGLYCVYEGGATRGGGQLWFNFGLGGIWSRGYRVADSNGNGFGTSNGPGLAVIDDKLTCWHEGAFQDGQLWVTNFDGSQWSPDHKVNVSTSGPPGLAVANIDETTQKLFIIPIRLRQVDPRMFLIRSTMEGRLCRHFAG